MGRYCCQSSDLRGRNIVLVVVVVVVVVVDDGSVGVEVVVMVGGGGGGGGDWKMGNILAVGGSIVADVQRERSMRQKEEEEEERVYSLDKCRSTSKFADISSYESRN